MRFPLKRWPKLLFAQVYTRNALVHRLIARLPRRHLDRPIFIIGVPRSGTSVFCTLFGGNRNLAHWSEAQAAWDPKWKKVEVSHRWTADRATAKEIRRIDNNFAYFTKWKKCERFLNKCPRNSLRIPFLMKGWPDAQIIFIQRDPRAVVNSLVNETRRDSFRKVDLLGRFARPVDYDEICAHENDVERFSLMVKSIHETLACDFESCVPSDQIFKVTYEEFGTDCRGMIRRVCEFCKIAVDEEVLVREVPEALENRNYKWAKQRTAEEIRIIDRILTPIVVELGYEEDAGWRKRMLVQEAVEAMAGESKES